jgi:DNA-binding HxlR family transcriptional regulator
MFCPIAMACEVVEPRWTMLILSEMWCGATRFNEIRRGVPGISPTLLSKRLKAMETQGLIERLEDPAKGTVDYIRTPRAIELDPVLELLGDWAYRNIEPEVALNNLKPDYLMWNLRAVRWTRRYCPNGESSCVSTFRIARRTRQPIGWSPGQAWRWTSA